jgi:hypothetical protein
VKVYVEKYISLSILEKGVEDTQIMLDIIQKATGKQTIDNADDAMNVLAELEK